VEQESATTWADQAEPIWETAYMSVQSLPENVRELRRQVTEFLSSSPLSLEEAADMELAVGEACANALRHGSPKGELDEIRVKCTSSERALVVEVSDNGCGFDPDSVAPPVLEDFGESGMGIFLMRTLADSVEFNFGSGTTVRLVKRCDRES